MAGLIVLTGTVSVISYAIESEPSSASDKYKAKTEDITETYEADSEESQTEKTDWAKADIYEYDNSLSLVSYEETTPEMLASVGVKTFSEGAEALTEEEFAAMTERRRKIKKASPSLTRKSRNAEPTTVELYLSGKPVGDIPPSRGVHAEAQPGDFAFVTYGWGHGVGMSQNGANFYAEYSGWTYQDILFHYYPGTFLMNTGLTDYEELTVRHQPAGDTLDVVSQIVYNEVGGSMSYEAIKAQAVAVYTYIKYNGDDSSDLRPKANPPQIVIDACSEVLGEALFYDGDYALTMFYASSGGCTANCYEVFYQDIPYLVSVPSDYDGAYDPHFGTVTYISAQELKSRIESAYGLTLSENPYNWIQPIYSEETGYITDILIDGQMYVKGYAFSLTMGLKSCKFDIMYTPPEDSDYSDDPSKPIGSAPMPDVPMPDVPVSDVIPDIQIPEEPEEPDVTDNTEPSTQPDVTVPPEVTTTDAAEPPTVSRSDQTSGTATVKE